jgi:hypothetical protein
MKLTRDPLIHFLLLGILFFVVYTAVTGYFASDQKRQIEITDSEITLLAEGWSRRWMRPPTEQELRGLVEARVREEILYREALDLGLDNNDVVVRRRMVQKMDLLTQDLSVLADPTDQELTAFYDERSEDYRIPPRLSFSHVYFNIDERGADGEAAALALLDELRSQSPAVTRAPERGDRFMLGHDYRDVSPDAVSREFGVQFAEALFQLPPDWHGPIWSGFGLHLVYVGDRIEGRIPDLADVRREVVVDFNRWRQEEAKDQLFEVLLDRYDVSFNEETIRLEALKIAGGEDSRDASSQ